MESRARIVVMIVVGVALAFAAAAPAQVRHFHPEKFTRATKTDGEGLIQWADHEKGKCPTCSGTGKMKCATCERFPDEAKKCPDCNRAENKEAVCHACAGTGSFPDPLDQVLCPGCMGAGYMLCVVCPGSGILKVGDAKRWSACPGCRGDGWSQCLVCEGKRLVPTLAVKPSLRDAEVADLEKALEETGKTLTALTAFTPEGKKTRKEVKDLAKILKDAQKLHPSFKALQKQFDKIMKVAYAGANFQGQVEREQHAMDRVKKGAEYYLQHSKHMLDLALERARANAIKSIKDE